MKIGRLMTRDVKTVRPSDSLEAAARLFWDHDCGAAPVVDEDRRVIGMLTDRDVCIAAYFQGKPLSQIRVESAMSREVVHCAEDEDVASAEDRMQSHQVRRLPVVGADGCLIGLLSLNDIAIETVRSARGKPRGATGNGAIGLARTLAAICAHRRATPERTTSTRSLETPELDTAGTLRL